MRLLLIIVLLLGIGYALMVFGIPGVSAYAVSSPAPSFTTDGTRTPQVSALAWGIFDTKTEELLFGTDVDGVHPIASVTKLMTAVVSLDMLAPEATTTLSRRAVATEGRLGGLKAGEVLSVRELLFPLLLESSNDAAEALAEYGGHDAFVAQMNATAQKLGMTKTAYADPSGLSPHNVSSVGDLAKMVKYLADTNPHMLDISKLEYYVGEEHIWHNVDKVAALETFRGGKHGYTDEADRTLAALFEESLQDGGTRIVTLVLLGSNNLQADVEVLRTFLNGHVAYR